MSADKPFSIRGLDHVVIRVRSLEAALRFYRDILGCELERERPDIGLYQLRAGSALIDLVPIDGELGSAGGKPPGDDGRNVDHVALAIDRFDEAALRNYLEQQGLDVPPAAERYGADGYGPSIYLQDPDGNTIELKGSGS